VLGTLVIQGLTLRPLLLLLQLEGDGSVEREISRARVAIMQAALDSLNEDKSPAANTIREQYAAARKVAEDQHDPQAATKYDGGTRLFRARCRVSGKFPAADELAHVTENRLPIFLPARSPGDGRPFGWMLRQA